MCKWRIRWSELKLNEQLTMEESLAKCCEDFRPSQGNQLWLGSPQPAWILAVPEAGKEIGSEQIGPFHQRAHSTLANSHT